MQWVIRNPFDLNKQNPNNPHVDATSQPKNVSQTQLQAAGHMEVQGREEVLVRIPGAVVHLVDGEESMEVGRGEFSLIRLLHGTTGLAVFAKVGDDLRWPITKDQPTVKIDSAHYLYSIRPRQNLEADAEKETADSAKFGRAGASEILNYGVTFEGAEELDLLDKLLKQYACFCIPKDGGKPVNERKDGEKPQIEKSEADYWADLAPRVEDYNCILARAIAAGSGQIIKGLFLCSNAYSSQVQKGGDFIRSRTMAKSKPLDGRSNKSSEIAKRNVKRVKKLSKMTEKMSENVLKGVITASGAVTGSILTSKAGRKFFAMLPGEVILASLDSFNKVMEAVELAGKDAFSTTSQVTTEVIAHSFGEDAGEVTQEAFEAAEHALGTAINVAKIKKAINPATNGNVSGSAIKNSCDAVTKSLK